MVLAKSILFAGAALLQGALAIDWHSICLEFPPAPGECAIIADYSQAFYETNDPSATLYDHNCNVVIESKDLDPLSPHFGWYGKAKNQEIYGTLDYVGAKDIGPWTVKIDGKVAEIANRPTRSVNQGVTVHWFRQANFRGCKAA
ncbi:hypothetical protein N3K66_002420 [Trichothecium roseum]|uniref:Uncharacterized protein n=1 Tax=Trichothecium roseum TaxID=47278 RepID=A0ACC0VC82_9HYPO|nr:hypothetical protein N3K66_002420 [Trichothecium roseum]